MENHEKEIQTKEEKRTRSDKYGVFCPVCKSQMKMHIIAETKPKSMVVPIVIGIAYFVVIAGIGLLATAILSSLLSGIIPFIIFCALWRQPVKTVPKVYAVCPVCGEYLEIDNDNDNI